MDVRDAPAWCPPSPHALGEVDATTASKVVTPAATKIERNPMRFIKDLLKWNLVCRFLVLGFLMRYIKAPFFE
jgi:hypothetical protein